MRAAYGALASCLLLAGCMSGRAPAPAPVPPTTGHPWDAPLADFERRERDAAESASREGRYAQALWAWDAVLAVAPGDTQAASRRAEVQVAADAAAAVALARAREARRRADIDAAVRAYLAVLAIAPDAEAADALRDIEARRAAAGNAKAVRAASAPGLSNGPAWLSDPAPSSARRARSSSPGPAPAPSASR